MLLFFPSVAFREYYFLSVCFSQWFILHALEEILLMSLIPGLSKRGLDLALKALYK